jgi:hypothetical protein
LKELEKQQQEDLDLDAVAAEVDVPVALLEADLPRVTQRRHHRPEPVVYLVHQSLHPRDPR